MKERDFLNWIVAAAEATGWKVWHVPAPMVANRKGGFVGSPRAAGLPDLFLLHDDPPRMVIAEVKGSGGKLSDKQQEFLRSAKMVRESAYTSREETPYASPLGVYAWWPEDQATIETILKSKVLL